MIVEEKPPLLFLGSQMTVGGAQKALLTLASWFQQEGWPVTTAFLYDKDGLLERWQAQYSFPIVDLHLRPGDSLWQSLRAMGRFYLLLRKNHVYGLVTFTHHANLFGIPLGWLAGARVRLATHRGRFFSLKPWQSWLHARLINSWMTSLLVAVTQKAQQESIQEGIRFNKVVVIPNGVDLPHVEPEETRRVRAEMGLAENAPLVLSVGRLAREKGPDLFLRSIPAVLANYPAAVFALAGDGPDRKALETLAHLLGIEGSVRFLGSRRDTAALLSAAEVFALPSRTEGMPNALLEAMAAGVPAAAFAVGGVPEVLHDEASGLLVPPEDVAAFSAALQRLLGDEKLREALAARARTVIEREYTRERMCRRFAVLLAP